MEASILGFEREGDIPGSEIPQRYFDWLRRRDGRLMADVFEHNRLDILSLAALAAHLTELINPEGETSRRHPGGRTTLRRRGGHRRPERQFTSFTGDLHHRRVIGQFQQFHPAV